MDIDKLSLGPCTTAVVVTWSIRLHVTHDYHDNTVFLVCDCIVYIFTKHISL